jgi:hypothetical protein
VRLYFDIEFRRGGGGGAGAGAALNAGANGGALCAVLLHRLASALRRDFAIALRAEHVLALESSSAVKFSRHLVLHCWRAAADGVAALFYLPQGVALSADGATVFVADAGSHTVRALMLVTCPAGYYCEEGSKDPTACPTGTATASACATGTLTTSGCATASATGTLSPSACGYWIGSSACMAISASAPKVRAERGGHPHPPTPSPGAVPREQKGGGGDGGTEEAARLW